LKKKIDVIKFHDIITSKSKNSTPNLLIPIIDNSTKSIEVLNDEEKEERISLCAFKAGAFFFFFSFTKYESSRNIFPTTKLRTCNSIQGAIHN